MAVNKVESQAVGLYLDQGVRIKVRAPFFLRIFRKKTISLIVRRPMSGTLARISRLYLSMGVDVEDLSDTTTIRDAHLLLQANIKKVSRMIAYSIARGYFFGWLVNRPLAAYLRWHADLPQKKEIAMLLISLSGITDFMTITRYLGMLKISTPRNPGQPAEEEGN